MQQIFEPLPTTPRKRGQEIAKKDGQIRILKANFSRVPDHSRVINIYNVTNTVTGWKCSCPDHEISRC